MARESAASAKHVLAERLVRALARGDLAAREVAKLGAPAHLARAIAFLERGTVEAVRLELDDAIALAPDAGVIHFLAAGAFFATRDYERALAQGLEAARLSEKGAGAAYHQLVEQGLKLARFHDVRAALERVPAALATDPQLASARDMLEEARVLADASAEPGIDSRARRLRDAVRIVDPERARARLDMLLADNPDSATAWCRAGELELWLGDSAAARGKFEAALRMDVSLSAAHAGLAGASLLAGELDAAASDRPAATEPSFHAFRGRALRLQGVVAASISALRTAVSAAPACVGAWLDLGLALSADGDHDGFVRVFRRLDRHASPLLSDAATELGVPMWRSDELAVNEHLASGTAAEIAVFEAALSMLRGNRSATCTTYFTRTGRLRSLPGDEVAPMLHAGDAESIARMIRIVCNLLDLPPRTSLVGGATSSGPTRVLTADEVEHFVAHGWVRVRGCFDRELAQAWIAAACQRIRTGAARFVEGDQAASESDVSAFDVEDPDTWKWARVDVKGARKVRMAEDLPRLWGAICDLMGGEQRIATTTMSDYFILRLRSTRPWAPPAPTGTTWHIDDPSLSTRLDSQRLGLLGLAFFSDVEERGGGTYIAPSSIRHVAHELAHNPGGVDFVGERVATDIIRACDDAQQVTGEVGDVILVHPLMLHSPSMNEREQIRWMANPAFHLREPLRHERPDGDYSPVERVIRRALDLEA